MIWIVAHAEPEAIKLEEIMTAFKADIEIQAVKKAIYGGEWSDLTSGYKNFESELCFAGEILLRSTRIVVPRDLRKRALQAALEGHPETKPLDSQEISNLATRKEKLAR